MTITLTNRFRLFTLLVVAVATVSFHYGWIIKPGLGHSGLFHAIHGRLCYIPIILGAIWYGVWGGVATAVFIVFSTLPYSFVGRGANEAVLASELTEMVFYVAIGLMGGILTELQRAERRRSEVLSRELAKQEHLSSLGQMAAGLAHEIKNPLGSIQGSAEILGDDFPKESPKYELVQVLAKETNRLNRVVEDFLNFARPRRLQRTPTRINALLDDVLSQLETDRRFHTIRVTKGYDESLPEALFDAEQLHQVFLNVALNAVNAMADGGDLVVETRAYTRFGSRWIDVAFKDTGCGMPPGEADRIFDPFYTTREKGTGLGLSISHTIVQNHGGRIAVRPNDKRGTVVTVSLPVGEKS